MPAGTGVWVVNTPPARTASTASANESPPATCSRMRSSERKPAWPSLVWNTCGSQPEGAQRPHAADAEDDLLAQPVLDVAAVQPVGDAGGLGLLPATAVSSRYSGTRPTSTCQTAHGDVVAGDVDG